MDENCIFCKIANGEIPSATLYEDKNFRVILDLSPASKGHALILPKKHAANLFELTDETASKVMVLAKQIAAAQKEGEQLGLTADELAFYDALTKPQAIKDFYENEELIAITKELAETLRKNKTIDWQKRESARAKMRMLIKKLLKKHKYTPEGMEDAVQTVMLQCELWTDNNDMEEQDNDINAEKIVSFAEHRNVVYKNEFNYSKVAEETVSYGVNKD